MSDKKTTELPENTSLNDNDKFYHVSAGGVSKFMRLSTLVNFILALVPPSTGGAEEKYLGRIETADIPTTGELGEYFQNSDTGTYWKWTPDDSEDPTGPGSFQDTGDLIESIEFDVSPTPGSVNAVTSDGIYQALSDRAHTEHAHSTSEAWLNDIINLLVSKTGFIDQLSEKVEQGSGISLSIVGGKLRISASGVGAEAGDFVSIGGLPLDNTALAAEFAKYQKPPVWTAVTPVDGVVTLPAVNGTNDYYEYTESGPVTLAHSGTFEDAGYKRVRVTLSSASHTVTLGAGYVDKRGAALPSIELTGAPGDEVDYWLDRKGSNWYVYKDGDESTGTGLPSGGTTGQVLKKQSDTDGDADWEDETGGGGNGETIQKTFTQTTHGFVVGNVLRHNGTIFTKAQANSSANSEVVGIVSEIVDANSFVLTLGGFVDITGLGLTANTTYFLSNTTAGELTDTAPTTIGHVSKPLLITTTTTEAYFINFRGVEITDPSDIGTGFISLTTPTGAAPTITLDATGVTSPIINRKLTVDNTSTGDITFATTAFTNGVIYTVVVKNNDAISRNLILPAGASYIPYNTADSKSLILPSGRRQILAFTYDGAEYHITRLPQ